jgi:hypothetical protein
LEREQLGFVPLGEYEAYLENELSNSEFSKKIIQRFDTINQLHQYYEDFSITFDSMSEILNESNPHKYIKSIYAKLVRFLYKGIIINHNKKLSQPTLKRRFFKKKAAFFSWPGLGKEWC